MKVEVKTKGVVLTSKQKSQIEKQINKLKKFVSHIDPVNVEVSFIDQSGPNRGGIDQTVHIHVTMPKENIFIEEIDDRALRAFQFAYKTLERRLRRYSEKMVGDKRRKQSRFKAMVNVVGGAGRIMGSAGKAVGSAAGAVGRLVPKRKGRKK